MQDNRRIGFGLAGLLFMTAFTAFAQEGYHINVDQFGYLPEMEKVAVLRDPEIGYNAAVSYSAAPTLEVRRISDNQIVFSGATETWNDGNVHDQSGDRGWWFDFSEVSQSGDYFIYDPVNDVESPVFRIGNDVYAEVLKQAGRMFFLNRCNAEKLESLAGDWNDGESFLNPWQDANCRFIDDPDNAALEKDLRGGWFDAGDYNKYVTFTHSTLHNLLSAYEENPEAFTDDWNIPESGNGVPDLIDEVKYELDWLMRMTNPDGSVHIKMGNQNYAENSLSPPSANTDQRFYGPVCSSASITVASVFAHAVLVFDDIPALADYADSLRAIAQDCFEYSIPYVENDSFETDCDDGSIVAGDADRTADEQRTQFTAAAIYLFLDAGEEVYQPFIEDYYAESEQIANGFWGGYNPGMNGALVRYAGHSEATSAVALAINTSFAEAVTFNYNGFFGFSEADLYRAFMPEWSYHWGSNYPKAGFGNLNNLATASGLAPQLEPSLNQYVDECIHYFHGVNPQSMVYLSNMYDFGAERSVNEIYHGWFYDGTEYDHALTSPVGPPPGYLTGGPNAQFSISTLTPPAGQPLQKAYLDFNDGWPLNSWEISEPAIYYQAAYVRLLANAVGSSVLSDEDLAIDVGSVKIWPNPSTGTVTISQCSPSGRLALYDLTGRMIRQLNGSESVFEIDGLPTGIYILQMSNGGTEKIVVTGN